jgi:alkyldihydroxyacetonephosphate synthase
MSAHAAHAAASLRDLLAADAVVTDEDELRLRSRDWWPLARLREIRGDAVTLPRAVVLPRSTDEVARVLAWATATGTKLVPRGLGSGVCGAVMPQGDSVVLELSRMDGVLATDLESQAVHVQAGIRGGGLEAHLESLGLTLGHYPQSIELSTVGGWIAAWSAGQASPGYGFIEDHVLGLTFVLADGTVVSLPPSPRPAAGPDLRRLVIGTEGTLAVVTEAWLSCAPADPGISWQAFVYPGFDACLDATRELVRASIGPRVLRGWDEVDTAHGFGAKGVTSGSLGLVGIATSAPGLAGRQEAAARIAHAHGAVDADAALGGRWWAHRLDAVDLFESILGPERALGPGSVIDTIEVSALWRDLPAVYAAVRDALSVDGRDVRGHFSHVFSAGAALYFTFFIVAEDDALAEERYLATWRRTLAACQLAGGSVAHHHGLGRQKASVLEGEIGAGGVALLRRIKEALDPADVLNPGVLLP